MDKNLFSSRQNDLNAQYLSVPSANYLASTPEEEDEVLDINWVLAAIKCRALVMLIVSATLATLSGSFIIENAKKTISEYEGKFTVLVEPITSDDQLAQLFVKLKIIV